MRLARMLFVVASGLLALPPVTGAQGLGDASKKEKERRDQGKAPKAKTYKQEELATLPPVANEPGQTASDSTPPPVVESAAPIFPSERAPAADSEENARRGQETQWHGSVTRAQARVERARKEYEARAALNLVPGYRYVDKNGRTLVGSVEELQKLTAQAKTELDAAERALAELLERARRENVPPGWLR
jgi:hypothetical protein